MKLTVRLIALLLSAVMIVSLAACGGDKDASAEATDVPVITQSPDGEITAGPTASPDTETDPDATQGDEPADTDVPVITDSPDGEVTAGPTATPETAATASPADTAAPASEAPASEAPNNTTAPAGTPGATSAPAATSAPGVTAAPTSPASTETAAEPDPNVPHPSEPNDFVAEYAGQVVDCSGLSVGDTFFWTLDLLNEHSCIYAAQWLVEIPDCLEPVSSSDSWSGGIKASINAAWDEGEPDSDKPQFAFNLNYEGQTGSSPYGEAGKHYTIIGMYITSFDFGGVQQAGSMVRIKYKLTKLPKDSEMEHDAQGAYVPLRVTVIESAAMITSLQCVTHGTITVSDGKLYFGH